MKRMERLICLVHSALVLGLLQSGAVGARRLRGGRSERRASLLPSAPHRQRGDTTTTESFALDFTAVEDNMDSFMTQVKNLAQSLYPCSAQKLDNDMKLHFLENMSVTCNDGTPAGRCCRKVAGDSRGHTGSRWGGKIFCIFFFRFIPYCSSDVWSGATPKTDQNDYAFMGSLIIKEVVKNLLSKGLDNGKILLLAGSSAGGTGVLLNVDAVSELLEELGHPNIQVRGLSDSGWFLDNKQYLCTDCVDTISCAPTEAIKRGIKYWGGVVPERCRLAHEGSEWNCFFGYRVYPTIRRPVFVVQWLFDEAQLTVDNIHLMGQPVQEGQWRYIQNLGIELRNTLKDVPAMFAPACLSHEVITRNYWIDIQVKGTSLPRALHCWERSLHDNSKNSKAPPKGCPMHLIDNCPWPHCNPTCPTIRDQVTGQEMNVIQFLMHMGFDVQKMAQQQGMDPSKLLGMLSSGS
uniref:Notum, palmitoleoyl-protein carboxylesterase n=1 Tax=Pygocentrus nattereri TaxID=42514 RepID=A0AAR2LAA3_PYGNA